MRFWIAIAVGLILTRGWQAAGQQGAVPPLPPVFSSEAAAPSLSSPTPPIPSLDESEPPEVRSVIDQGLRLERQSRWGEALGMYEEALREFPESPVLQSRFHEVRLRHDVARRYSDPTFLSLIGEIDESAALGLYDEVLLKIQSHYVEAPRWRYLVEQGTHELELALLEPKFLSSNGLKLEPAATMALADELRRTASADWVRNRAEAREFVAQIARRLHQRIGLPVSATVLEYLCGATNSLDVYSAYLTPGQLSEVYSQIEGRFVGLGVELKADAGSLLIVRVIPRSPAEQAGIRADDRIVAVDGKPLDQMSTDQAANMLQGPEGSVVQLEVLAADGSSKSVRVERARVDVPSVTDVRMLDSAAAVGFMRVVGFQRGTPKEMDEAIGELTRQGMQSLIIDLRRNPGGLLTAAVEAADRFLPQGIIVATNGRVPQENLTYSAQGPARWGFPVVILVDRESASAAEIFAGALQENGRATVVGTRSYGKGSIQGIFPLANSEAGVRLTTAKFYSPKGRPYAHRGVEPDVLVQQAARPVDGWRPIGAGRENAATDRNEAASPSEDTILQAGLNVARGMVARSAGRSLWDSSGGRMLP
ncbi:S41 family peptidase [Thermopirellula anaerolimosa]